MNATAHDWIRKTAKETMCSLCQSLKTEGDTEPMCTGATLHGGDRVAFLILVELRLLRQRLERGGP